jgi:hypothetical protein
MADFQKKPRLEFQRKAGFPTIKKEISYFRLLCRLEAFKGLILASAATAAAI